MNMLNRGGGEHTFSPETHPTPKKMQLVVIQDWSGRYLGSLAGKLEMGKDVSQFVLSNDVVEHAKTARMDGKSYTELLQGEPETTIIAETLSFIDKTIQEVQGILASNQKSEEKAEAIYTLSDKIKALQTLSDIIVTAKAA